MIKKILPIAVIGATIYGCKPTEVVNLPEKEIIVNDPQKLPEPAPYQASYTKHFDLTHTKLAVKFNWEKAYLYGQAELTLKPYFHSTDKLELDARGMDIHKVQLVGEPNKDLTYNYENDVLAITLDKVYSRKDTFKVFIDYTSKPDELEAGGSAAITSDKGLYFINPRNEEKNKPQQIWTQGETESNSAWFPTIEASNERCTGEIAITIEDKYKTLSNGVLTHQEENGDGTRTDFWEMDQPHAPYLFMMAIGEFAIVKDKWRDLLLEYYVEPNYEQYANDIFGLTSEMMEFYSNKLGVDYPWQKYSQVVVRDYVSGAMENTTAVIHGDFVQQTARELLDGSAGEDVIAHELFHHWFGDLVTCESWSNLPLNESFATYGEYLWNEYKYGLDKADDGLNNDLRAYLQESKGKQVDMVRFDYQSREDMFDAHSYQKGGRILHMLRNYMGDDAFFESLKFYLNQHQYSDVEMHEFRMACEDVSGEDLNWFFNQWFFASGHPVLNINYEYNDSLKIQKVLVEQTQNFTKTPLYKLPMKIDVYVNGKKETHEVVVDKAINEFEFEYASKPSLVNVDADKIILCEKTDRHSIEEFAYMYNHAPKYKDRHEAIKQLANSNEALATKTVIKALGDKYEKIRRLAISSIALAVKADPEKVKGKLLDIVTFEENTIVKGDAIDALAVYFAEDEEVVDPVKSGLEEKSYYVLGSSLNALSEISKEESMKYAKQMESEENFNIKSSVAAVYEKHGGKEQHPFFQETYKDLGGFQKYSFVRSYGNYLKNQEQDVLTEAVPMLREISLKEEAWWMRMTGINAVAELESEIAGKIEKMEAENSAELTQKIELTKKIQSDLMDIIKTAKEEETNPRLKQYLDASHD